MEEGDQFAVGAGARLFVDEANAGAATTVEGAGQVVDGEADVVDAGSALGEEPGDGRVRLARLEQFDERLTGAQSGDAGAIGVVEGYGRQLEDVAIERQD